MPIIIFFNPKLITVLLKNSINTNRLFWHSGAGKDSDEVFDRYESEKKILGNVAEELDKKLENKIKTKREKQLEKL